jgi:hypothetical protein
MAAVEQTKRVGDTSYKIAQFPATRANKYLVRLLKMFGPALGELMSIDPKKTNDPEQIAKIGKAFQKLAETSNEDDFDALIKDLLELTFVGNVCVRDDFDIRFQGKLGHMYQLLAQVCMVNYADFIGDLAAKYKQRQAVAGSVSPSPSI